MILVASVVTAGAVGLVVHTVLRSRGPVWGDKRSKKEGVVPGLDISALRFWTTVVGVALLTYLTVFAITGLVVVAAIPAVVVATFPKTYFARKRAVRLAAVQEAWPDGLRDLLASVKSGSGLPNAIENLATFGPEPLRQAFRGFGSHSRSLGVVKALEMVKKDLADPTSDRVLEVLILAYERGGSVVPEILSDLATSSTRDLWTMEQIRSEALEQKINSRVVFALPWFVLVAMTAQSGAFRDFYSTPAGLLVVAIGGVMSLVGIVVASKLGSQPAEPRVFGESR